MSKPDKRTPQEDVAHVMAHVDAIAKEYAKQPTLASQILDEALDAGIAHAWNMSPEDLAAMEQKLAAMVDARLASLALRVDWLYRYTVGNREGKRYLVPPVLQRGEEFPE